MLAFGRQIRRAHREQLATLRRVTRLVDKNHTLLDFLNLQNEDEENTAPANSADSIWMKSIDLEGQVMLFSPLPSAISLTCCRGHTFDEASIPFPTIPSADDAATHTKANRPSPPSIAIPNPTGNADVAANDAVEASARESSPSASLSTSTAPSSQHQTVLDDQDEVSEPATYAQKAAEQPDGPVAEPADIAPPQCEEEANFDDPTEQLLDLESPERPAKVVHLPDADEQRRVENGSRRKSDANDASKASRTHLHAQGEAASSPSSTVGAYSAATPLPPQDSPDTSPNTDIGEEIEVLPPKELRPSPEEQRQKEEHDRLLEAQKEIARRQALGDVSTPDEQLKWEELEAAARDAEEQAARDAVAGPEPKAKRRSEETEAQEVVDDIMRDADAQRTETAPNAEDKAKVAPTAPMEEQPAEPRPDDDGDCITVKPRSRATLTIDTSASRSSSKDSSAQQTIVGNDRMSTRISSGAGQKRTVSDTLGRTPSQPPPTRGSMASSPPVSPQLLRHTQDSGPIATYDTPRRPQRRPDQPRTPNNNLSVLEELMALKGAAEDPDRDYLEPLFRIQAHDAEKGPTTSLSELVRSASKTLSTEDQFMPLRERLDYRVLRRIYQLQNANKWSLRQMERCKEPEQPVTHHDHMMAEMKWMRKDFKAERKMKVSICAWLARRCADWVAASAEERNKMQVPVRPPKQISPEVEDSDEQPPELEHSGESATDDDAGPPTPKILPMTLIVPPELSDTVKNLQKAGKLQKALSALPVTGFSAKAKQPSHRTLNPVSKFVEGKVLPRSSVPTRKRSRFDYDDDAEYLDEPVAKRLRAEQDLEPEDQESALFHPENKHIRDRLHANNAFRPPSEFVMPSTQFYEYRSGSQWLWEDDQKLKKLAKDYQFNWQLISDELQLPTRVKSSADRRTPWECFERWVLLEQLPTEMKKTLYFKTWDQRLEQSQQAAERRYQQHVAHLQNQNNGQVPNIPPRKKTTPTRVEKRRNTRYLWMIDAIRKGARKKEQAAFKQAEAHRAAAQRKSQAEVKQQPRASMTPQQWSEQRHQTDLRAAEAKRQLFLKQQEQRKMMMMRAQQAQMAAQQGVQNGAPGQARPGSSSNAAAQQAQMQPNGQMPPQQPNVNGQMVQQARQQIPMATRNGHLAVPHVGAQGMPQAQMRPNGPMPNGQGMPQPNAQMRNGQYTAQQQYAMQNGSMQSPGTGMTPQQQMQSNQAMLATLQQQMSGSAHQQNGQHPNAGHQMSSSPSMPPPPAPAQQAGHPQSLSSGHVPALLNIKSQLRAKYPNYTDEQINAMATDLLKSQSQNQSTMQARQNAMNAAAGIGGGVAPQAAHNVNMQAFAHNQSAYQSPSMANSYPSASGDMSTAQQQSQGGQGASTQGVATSPQQQYAARMRQMAFQQQQQMQHLRQPSNGSPAVAHASPQMQVASPQIQFAQAAQAAQMAAMGQQRPGSRSATPGQPGMQRLGSSHGSAGGMGSPGQAQMPQGSPRVQAQAGVAR